MIHSPKIVRMPILAASLAALLLPTNLAAQSAQIRHIAVVHAGGATEIQIETSQRLMPMTQVISDPDRLVIDFPDALPGPQLRTVTANQGEVKAVRASLLTAKPAMTRVVIDLKSAQDFRLVPTSNSVTVKLLGGATAANAVASATPTAPAHAEPARPEHTPEPVAALPAVAPTSVPKTLAVSAPARPTITVERTPTVPAQPPTSRATVVMPPPEPPAVPASTAASVPSSSSQPAQVRRVAVLKSGGAMEIEIETNQRVVPTTQLIAGPDRLVIDFPGALPGPQLRALAVNKGEVKGVRTGLLTSNPPVTRVVLDLKSPQEFQLFPSSKSVVVKLPGSLAAVAPPPAGLPQQADAAPAPPPEQPKKVTVSFHDGKLTLTSNKGSLADILNEVCAQTGAVIAVPAGAELEVVAVSIGPASPREALSQLLNGSRYNFIIVGTDADANQVERVVLSPKGVLDAAGQQQSPSPEPVPVAEATAPARSVRTMRSNPPPPPTPVPATDDVQPQGDSNPPPDTTPQPGDPQPAPN